MLAGQSPIATLPAVTFPVTSSLGAHEATFGPGACSRPAPAPLDLVYNPTIRRMVDAVLDHDALYPPGVAKDWAELHAYNALPTAAQPTLTVTTEKVHRNPTPAVRFEGWDD